MTQAEKKVEAIKKEIGKLQKSLDRVSGLYIKNHDKCIKLGCDWTDEEFRNNQDNMTDIQFDSWFKMYGYKREIESIQGYIENALKRLAKAEGKAESEHEQAEADAKIDEKEASWMEAMKKAKAEYEAWLEQFKAECLEDGIIIDTATSTFISGWTASDKKFSMVMNWGCTIRSRHCYTLKIEGNTIFTSGTFGTGYNYIRR